MAGRRKGSENAPFRKGHGYEQLIGEMFSDRNIRCKIATGLGRCILRNRFRAHAVPDHLQSCGLLHDFNDAPARPVALNLPPCNRLIFAS